MISKAIGKGSFGEIFQGYDNQTNQEVAIKMVRLYPKNNEIYLGAQALQSKGVRGRSQDPETATGARYLLVLLFIILIEGFPKMYWFGQEHN